MAVSSSLGPVSMPRMVDEQPAHGCGGEREEVCPIGTVDLGLIHQLEKRFVDNIGCLPFVPGQLTTELSRGDRLELRIQMVEQCFGGRPLEFAARLEQLDCLVLQFVVQDA